MTEFTSRQLVDLFRLVALRLAEARMDLGALDGAIGDADHGNSMAEGFAAVVRATASEADLPPGRLLGVAGRSFLSAVGATTGPLYASALMSAGRQLGDRAGFDAQDLANLVPAFADGIRERGKARPGDKTMMDVWSPAARAVADGARRGLSASGQLRQAEAAAIEGREATRAMVAAVGRAARLGARSLGHVDPGAASAAIIISALREWLDAQAPASDGGPG
jgi:dihydroxyacetone kinase-like protein